MKNFIGKILNIVGIVGLIFVSFFVIINFSMNFMFVMFSDYNDFLLHSNEVYYLVPTILFSIEIIMTVILIIFDLIYLIRNRVGKIPFVIAFLFTLYVIIELIVILYLRIAVQGLDKAGLNVSFVIWCASFIILFSVAILVGNLLNFKRAK